MLPSGSGLPPPPRKGENHPRSRLQDAPSGLHCPTPYLGQHFCVLDLGRPLDLPLSRLPAARPAGQSPRPHAGLGLPHLALIIPLLLLPRLPRRHLLLLLRQAQLLPAPSEDPSTIPLPPTCCLLPQSPSWGPSSQPGPCFLSPGARPPTTPGRSEPLADSLGELLVSASCGSCLWTA